MTIAGWRSPRSRAAAELTSEFLRLQSHYLFQAHFCLVRRVNEKGKVEGLVGFTRRNFLVPVPRVETLQQLNAELARRCDQYLDRTLRGKSGTKRELLAADRQAMLDLPRQSFWRRGDAGASVDCLSGAPGLSVST